MRWNSKNFRSCRNRKASRTTIAAILFVAALSVCAALRSQSAPAAVSASVSRTSTSAVACRITSAHVGGGHASAKGSCGKGVPISWKTSLKLASPSGPCVVAHPNGTSKSFAYAPVSASATVTFKLSPRRGAGQSVSKTVTSRPVIGSRDMCQFVPSVTTTPTADTAHPGCTWPTASNYGVATELYSGGDFACPASWGCGWSFNVDKSSIYQHQLGFNIIGAGEVKCSSVKSYAYTQIGLYFRSSPTAPTGCYKELTYVTSLKLPSSLGGYVWWNPQLYTVVDGSVSRIDIPPKGSYASWNKLPGSTDPCQTLPGVQPWNYNASGGTTTATGG